MANNTRPMFSNPREALGFPGMVKTCEINHCANEYSDEVGIRLCVEHLKKAWAAYEILRGTEIDRFRGEAEKPPTYWEKKGTIYFAQVGEHVKIGYTCDVRRRMNELSASGVYYTEPGTRRDEADYHKLFKKYLAKGNEYFHPVPVVMNFIRDLQSGVAA